jgi:hypothetical protein
MTTGKWTTEEGEILHRMVDRNISHCDISAALGRSVKSIQDKLWYDNATNEEREIRRRKRRKRYRVKHPSSVSVREHPRAVEDGRPTEEVLAERDRRYALPEPAFGDPLPGYSALDRMPAYAVDKLR